MIAIIDYDGGNTKSVMNALERLNVAYVLSDDPDEIGASEKVIFPGVGHAGAAMQSLEKKGLDGLIRELKQPVLGICVGMQLMCDYSEEGNTTCLGIIPGQVKKMECRNRIKIPHMGWNQLKVIVEDHLLKSEMNDEYYYFVHSYFVTKGIYTTSTCEYAGSFSASIRKDNFYGIQFHAEKSGMAGEHILSNFVKSI